MNSATCVRDRQPNQGIPGDLIREFDYFNLPSAAHDPHKELRELLDGPELFYTPCNGGHWVAASGRLLKAFVENHQVFGNYPAVPKAIATFDAPKMIPEELDPPEHGKYRRIFASLLSPARVAPLRDAIAARSNRLIDAVYDRGGCDFVAEISTPLPVDVFLEFAGLPKSDLPRFMAWVEQINRGSDPVKRTEAHNASVAYFAEVLKDRRAQPGPDVMSELSNGEVDGRPLNEEEYISMAMLLLQGGLDTTTSALSLMVRYLAEHPQARGKLAREPERIPAAIDELTRWLGVVNNMRTIRADIEVDGVWMKLGEQVLLPQWLRGIDERMTPGASKVDLDRPEPKSFLFGAGVHRCAGASLAQLEMRVFLREWLGRIPDFRIAPDKPVVTYGGIFMGVRQLPLEWTA